MRRYKPFSPSHKHPSSFLRIDQQPPQHAPYAYAGQPGEEKKRRPCHCGPACSKHAAETAPNAHFAEIERGHPTFSGGRLSPHPPALLCAVLIRTHPISAHTRPLSRPCRPPRNGSALPPTARRSTKRLPTTTPGRLPAPADRLFRRTRCGGECAKTAFTANAGQGVGDMRVCGALMHVRVSAPVLFLSPRAAPIPAQLRSHRSLSPHAFVQVTSSRWGAPNWAGATRRRLLITVTRVAVQACNTLPGRRRRGMRRPLVRACRALRRNISTGRRALAEALPGRQEAVPTKGELWGRWC